MDRMLAPLRNFLATEASSGILLLAATVVALAWANSPMADSYEALWSTPFTIQLGDAGLTESLHFWINDGLMAIFFFVVGLEIKRELLIGELSPWRRALLPIAAACGGAVVPALIFIGLTRGGPGSEGWGVPMATDIAFALGVMAVLGSRVPIGLKVFVTALAIVDDLLAILVIALFYASDVSMVSLGAAVGLFVLLLGANRIGIRHYLVYAILGLGLWVAVLGSGVHATIAGVALAFTVPATTRIDGPQFVRRARELVDAFEHAGEPDDVRRNNERQAALADLEDAAEGVQTPLQRLENNLHPLVAYVIVPLFALANAGVAIGSAAADAIASPVAHGVFLGLLVGKQVGILATTWLVVRLRWSELPTGTTWRHMWGASWVAGIGFTMSLFIAELAFGDEPTLHAVAKIAVLSVSVVAAIGGWIVLRRASAAH